ncbi:hypothetical protein ACFPN7_02010 [Amycolatopsis halotolerans]|uniref:hypothetical protein n=1 Tax=Amycolatopsis halotolerans TaxID=330083 RepID=UPI003613FECD
MYVLMRAFEVEYTAARWREFHGGQRSMFGLDSDAVRPENGSSELPTPGSRSGRRAGRGSPLVSML